MKVLLVNATYGNGSTGTIVSDIQRLCLEAGIDCKVAYASSTTPAKEIYGFKTGNWFSNKMHALLSRISGKAGYFSLLSTWNLIREIDRFQPDVIHIHNLHSNYIHLNRFLKAVAKRDIPLVVTLHDCWFFTGGCMHFTAAGCDKWKDSCGNCPQRMADTPAYLKDSSARILADRKAYFGAVPRLYVVGVSEWISNAAAKNVFKNADIRTIRNGIDLDIFKPTPSDMKKKLGLEGKRVILGPAGKWLAPINRELLEKVSQGLPDDTVLLLFGYSGTPGSVTLRNVQTVGFMTDKTDLAKLYSTADLFANCSREESLGLINIEAQACGTPVISFANTGLAETIHPERSKAVATGDVEMFTEALATNIDSKGRHDTSESLRDWVSANFDKNKNYQKYLHLFK